MGIAANLESQRKFEFTVFDPKKSRRELEDKVSQPNLQLEFLIDATFPGKIGFRCRYKVDSVIESAGNCSLFRWYGHI